MVNHALVDFTRCGIDLALHTGGFGQPLLVSNGDTLVEITVAGHAAINVNDDTGPARMLGKLHGAKGHLFNGVGRGIRVGLSGYIGSFTIAWAGAA